MRNHQARIPLRGGTSLVEVLVSIGILSIALLGLTAALIFHFSAAEHAENYTCATGYARQILDAALANHLAFSGSLPLPDSSGLMDGPGISKNLFDPPFDDQNFPKDGQFRRHVQVTSSRTPEQSGANYNYKDDVRQISVTILWSESSRPCSLTLASMQRQMR